MFTLRPLRVPDDFPALAEMMNAVSVEPMTTERLIEAEGRPQGMQYRVVAVDGEGALLGYGYVRRRDSDPAGLFFVGVHTAAGAGSQGIGSAVLADVESHARQFGAARVEAFVRDNQPESLTFARHRGYEQRRHLFESIQDLSAFDPEAFAADVVRVTAQGIRLFTLADEPGEATERKLYDLYTRTEQDVPGLEIVRPTFEQWREMVLARLGFRPEHAVVAADGERFVGCTVLFDPRTESGGVYIRYTGVDPAYRGRGIALAMKIVMARVAKALGVPYLRTNNDSENGPMLAVNRKLGCTPAPGIYVVQKSLLAVNRRLGCEPVPGWLIMDKKALKEGSHA